MGHLAVVLGASLSLLSIPPVVETQTGGGLSAAFLAIAINGRNINIANKG